MNHCTTDSRVQRARQVVWRNASRIVDSPQTRAQWDDRMGQMIGITAALPRSPAEKAKKKGINIYWMDGCMDGEAIREKVFPETVNGGRPECAPRSCRLVRRALPTLLSRLAHFLDRSYTQRDDSLSLSRCVRPRPPFRPSTSTSTSTQSAPLDSTHCAVLAAGRGRPCSGGGAVSLFDSCQMEIH